jgi:hypothetical protein
MLHCCLQRLAFVLLALAAVVVPAQAGWFTKILKEAGEAAEHGGRRMHLPDGFGALDDAARHIKGVSAVGKGVPLAAHVTPEGHWKFANKEGEVFTAGNAEEMKRVLPNLAAQAPADTKVSLYLSDETVFEGRGLLKDLPPEADLFFVDGKASYPLTRSAAANGELLFAAIKPNIVVEIGDRRMFEEAVFQLARPLNKSSVRLLALEPGGPKRLSSVPGFDPATKEALVDTLDPAHLDTALASLRGQSVVVTGRVQGGRLFAGDVEVPLEKLTRAAEASDVNLVVLQSQATRQPGGRNWLWQKVAVTGYGDALKQATFADFLNALGATRGELSVTAAPAGLGRITLKAIPTGDAARPITDQVGDWMADAASHVTGEVITKSVDVHARDKATQTEHDVRIVPWLPSIVHVLYLGLWVLGLFCSPVSRGWWQRVWPREARGDYKGVLGFWAARLMRGLAFVFLFMPIAALPALPVMAWRIVWSWLTLPSRIWRWLFGDGTAKAA